MAKKTNKTNEPFSVKDFKMWLLGLTEFQEAGWTPNTKQWKTILEKVEMLEDNVQYVHVSQPSDVPSNTHQTNNPQVNNGQVDHPLTQIKSFDISNTGGAGAHPETRFLDDGPKPPTYGGGTTTQTPMDSGIVSIDITKPGSFI